MILDIKNLERLLHLEITLAAGEDFYLPGEPEPILSKGSSFTLETLERMRRRRVQQAPVQFSRQLLKHLHEVDPAHYPLPQAVESLEDFSKRLKAIDFANRRSRYRRNLFLMDEPEDAQGNPLLAFGSAIPFADWPRLRAAWPGNWPVAFRYSEHKILVYLNLSIRSRESRHSLQQQIAILKALHDGLNTRREYVNLKNLSFYRDVLIVEDPDKLVATYEREDVRLILVASEVVGKYRDALVVLKRFDPYARFFLPGKLDPENADIFLLAVESNYTRDNYM